jgi:RNA polymerase sigma factor (sigma-70 family)
MASGSLTTFLRHLRRLATRHHTDRLPDGMLLQRFTADHDEAAFAALMDRHGPLVLAVGQRLLHDRHAAEDVFQATFLVLARKAASIRKRESLASWLYGVAYRLAVHAKTRAVNRSHAELRSRRRLPAEPAEEVTWRELGAVLDEELQRLPEKYRTPLVLCYLEGRTQDEAATQLGWTKGTLRRRLEQGRELLRVRLVRRGVTLSTGLLATVLSQGSVSAGLVDVALDAALAFHLGESLATPAAVLAEGVLSAMWIAKVEIAIVALVTVGLLGVSAGVATHHALADKGAAGGAPAAVKSEPPAKREPPDAGSRGPKAARTDRSGDPLPDGAIARLGTTRWRHGMHVFALAFSSDGKFIATAGAPGRVCVWDALTGREVRVFPVRGDIHSVAFTPDGRKLVVPWHSDNSVRMWEIESGKELRQFKGHQLSVSSVAVSPDGKTLASGSHDETVRLWDITTGRELFQLNGRDRLGFALAFSPDGALLASGGGDRTVRVWDRATGKERFVLRGHEGAIRSVRFSPDGKLLATGSDDGTLCVWNLETQQVVRRIDDKLRSVNDVAFSPDGSLLASGNRDRTIRLWDVGTGMELRRWEAGTYYIRAIAFSRDGKVLVSGSSWNSVRRWDVATGQEIGPLSSHLGLVGGLLFTPDGRTLFSQGFDKRVVKWDLATGTEQVLFGGPANGVLDRPAALAPDGQTLASGQRRDYTVRLWDFRTGKELRTLGKHKDMVSCLAFSSDGKFLASGSEDKTARLWDCTTGKELFRFEGTFTQLDGLAFSPDHRLLAMTTRDQTLRLWDTTTGKERNAWASPSSDEDTLVFSADGRWLALASGYADPSVQVWHVATGKLRHRLIGHTGGAYSAAFSPDGRFLATGGVEFYGDNTVRLWEMASGQEVRQYQGHHSGVLVLAYTPDGRTLASGGGDANVMLWDVTDRRAADLPRNARIMPGELEDRWKTLGGEDAAKAYQSIWDLAAVPAQAVPFLRERLRPPPCRLTPSRWSAGSRSWTAPSSPSGNEPPKRSNNSARRRSRPSGKRSPAGRPWKPAAGWSSYWISTSSGRAWRPCADCGPSRSWKPSAPPRRSTFWSDWPRGTGPPRSATTPGTLWSAWPSGPSPNPDRAARWGLPPQPVEGTA